MLVKSNDDAHVNAFLNDDDEADAKCLVRYDQRQKQRNGQVRVETSQVEETKANEKLQSQQTTRATVRRRMKEILTEGKRAGGRCAQEKSASLSTHHHSLIQTAWRHRENSTGRVEVAKVK